MINHPKDMGGEYTVRCRKRLVVSTGAVTLIAARTATAGQLLTIRYPSSTASKMYVKYIGARFILTTAYTTAQETGCDLILARSYTVNGTAGTAVDVGSTVADTNNLATEFGTSLITAGCARVADASAITAGTHTLDANPIGITSGWSSAIGIMVPEATAGAKSDFATLFDARQTGLPLKFGQDEGFVVRNTVLMGAVGVGRWDFCVEWDEGTPHT